MEIRHYRFDRITLNPDKCFGKPCIRGLRIPVASILSYLSSGMSIEDILREWPELEPEDIYQALGYAAWMMEEKVPLREYTDKEFQCFLEEDRLDMETLARIRCLSG